ncbi:MAG: FeoB-associated Cys-rich membrane protein [Bacteroidales bacterium]|nr:FeoB-associated Cys-rich membrane protein [Bacteroidales bacterium]
MSLSFQYAIVFLILLLIAIWVIVTLIRHKKTPGSHCPGCNQTNCPAKTLPKKPCPSRPAHSESR